MTVDEEVLKVLDRSTVDGEKLVLPEQLDRKLYLATAKALEAAGAKWNRAAKAHVFTREDAADRIDDMIVTGQVESPKDDFDFFPTPPDVVTRMLEVAKIEPGMWVLEPSAGDGSIVRMIPAAAHVDCVEIRPGSTETLLRAQSARPGEGLRLGGVVEGDFLSMEKQPAYHRVLMNPPFGRRRDVDHITHAAGFLTKKDGLLVAVASAGVAFRDDSKGRKFRELVEWRGGKIVPLPDGSFKQSGTMVRTVLVTMGGSGPF